MRQTQKWRAGGKKKGVAAAAALHWATLHVIYCSVLASVKREVTGGDEDADTSLRQSRILREKEAQKNCFG